MKKRILVLLVAIMLAAVLAACAGASASTGGSATAVGDTVSGGDAALSANYPGALPVEAQLTLGTMQLEGTDLAVTAEQAAELLPYWRVLQSLAQSDNTADAEIEAVLKQIEGVMTGEQISAIAAMQLTEDQLQTMLEEGALGFGRSFDQGVEGGKAGDGFAGGPGGGFMGGPPGGGPGGGPGTFGGDPAAFETRQAELEAGGENPASAFMARGSTGLVVRLLETKTGQAPALRQAQGKLGSPGAALAVAGELTGLSAEELSAALAGGQTLGELFEANGVTAQDARAALMEAMADLPLPGDQDLASWVDGLLAGTFGEGRMERPD